MKIKYIDKPHLKKNAGWWGKAWYRWAVWRDNRRYDYYDRHRRNLVIRILALVTLAAGIVIYSAVAPRPSNTVSTKLNTPIPFGNQNKNVQIESNVFNPDTGTLQVGLKFTSASETLVSDINMKRFKLSFDGDRYIKNSESEVNIIPTSSDTLVVQFVKLNTKFQDVRINVADKSLDVSSIAAVSEASSSSKKNTSDEQIGTVIVNNDSQLIRDNKQPVDTQKTLVLNQTNRKIDEQKSVIDENKSAIKKWHKAITEKTENIRETRAQMSDMTNEEMAQADDLIQTNQSAIGEFNTSISDAKSNIFSAKDKIKTLKKTYTEQQNGRLKVDKPY